MAQAALDMNRARALRANKFAKQNPSQARSRKRGQVIDASDRFVPNRTRRQQSKPGGHRAEVIPLNAAQVPNARNSVDEQVFKRDMAQKRHMDQMRAQQFALPDNFLQSASEFSEDEKNQMQDWYGEELEQGGMGDMIKAKLDQTFAQPIRNAVNKRIEELKQKAIEKVKAKAKEQFKKAFKKAAGKGTKKAIWSAVDQGAVIEVEGAALESWFSFGTVLTSWQGLTGALNGGKPFIAEGTVISWAEPPPLTVPSGKPPDNAAESVGMLINLYDLFMWLLIPVYWMLLIAVIALIHLAIVYTLMPFIIFATVVTYLGITFF